MKQLISLGLLVVLLISCNKEKPVSTKTAVAPHVENQGKLIRFSDDQKALSFFQSETIKEEDLSATYQAPGAVAVSVVAPASGGVRKNVLFDNPDLGAAYAQFLQHLVNINTFRVNLDRAKDLAFHNAATGKEVLEAETQLANEEAAITEHEAKLKLAGLEPEILKKPNHFEAWLLCEVPESQVGNISVGSTCKVNFTAFPDESISAHVNGLAAEVDPITRMIKVRVHVPNPKQKYQVGMFAQVTFQLHEGKVVSIPISALVNVQGRDYAFVKTSANEFERRELTIGQELNGRVVVLSGLRVGEAVVSQGAMELKGISFGY